MHYHCSNNLATTENHTDLIHYSQEICISQQISLPEKKGGL